MNPHISMLPALLAQLGGNNISDLVKPQTSALRPSSDFLPFIAALAGIVFLVILLVVISRRRKICRLSKLSRSAWPASASRNQTTGGTLSRREPRRHRRRKYREPRTRNPTLADTGGLPPRRPEGQPPQGT